MLKKIDPYNCSGTSLMGYVTTTYANLVEVLGDPNDDGDGYKIDAEWVLSDEDGTVITIYNYKDGPNYCGQHGTFVQDITEWHIGGRNAKVLDIIRKVFPTAEVRAW